MIAHKIRIKRVKSAINFKIAQIAHFSIGANFVAWPVVLWPNNPTSIVYSVMTILIVDAIKEFTYDLKCEPGETIRSGFIDWSVYLLGVFAGLIGVFTIRPLL